MSFEQPDAPEGYRYVLYKPAADGVMEALACIRCGAVIVSEAVPAHDDFHDRQTKIIEALEGLIGIVRVLGKRVGFHVPGDEPG